MFGDNTSSRWLAIVGVGVLLSTCAACMLVLVLLTSAYGGQTIRLRNPFAPPAPPVVSNNTPSETINNSGTAPNQTNNSGTAPNQTNNGGNVVNTSGDAAAFLPSLSGYTRADASSITGALDLVIGADFSAQAAEGDSFSAQSLSGIATSILVSRLDEFIQCYQRSGAVDGRVYIKADVAAVLSGAIPPMGAVVVANQNRLRDSLVGCAVTPNDPNSFSAQSANQPCGNIGNFEANGETLTYLYAGSATDFCTAVEAHFSAYGS